MNAMYDDKYSAVIKTSNKHTAVEKKWDTLHTVSLYSMHAGYQGFNLPNFFLLFAFQDLC